MNTNNAEKIFQHLHHCMNLMHRLPCGGHGRRRGHGHGNGQAHGSGQHRGQGRIMALLQERDGIGQRELAELLHVRPPSLSELLDKLESNGMIERRQNATDRRMSQVFLTDTGREAAARFEATREERMGMLCGLTESEQESLSQLLEKFVNSLKDQFGAGLGRGQGGRGRGNHEHGPCVCGHGHGGDGHHECQCGNPERRGRGPGSNHFSEEGQGHHHPCGGHGHGKRHGHHHDPACGCGGQGHDDAHGHEAGHEHHGCCKNGHRQGKRGGCG